MSELHQRQFLVLGLVLASLLIMGSLALLSRPLLAGAPPVSPALVDPPARVAALNDPPLSSPSPTPGAVATLAPALMPTPLPTPLPMATPAPSPALLPTPDGQTRTVRVPILMYHYISDPPPGANAYRVDLSVPPQEFEAQLSYLQSAGYTGITLEDLLLHLTVGHPLPPKPIILTFDDGYIDNFVYAFPLLSQYQFRATFFVITSLLDQGHPDYIDWEQAALMEANGMDIQAHGVSHVELRGQGAGVLASEIVGARDAIQAHLHKPVRFFCYPFGHYDPRVIEGLRSAGYWAAVTTEAGVLHASTAPFQLKRVRIHGTDKLDRFKATLDYYMP